MDERSVRAQLSETKDRLRQVEEEREILLSLVHGFEGWLRLRSTGATTPVPEAPPLFKNGHTETVPPGGTNNKPQGSVSMRSAVKQVIREAHGAPIHTKEILKRVTELGAVTTGSKPESIVDLNAMSLSKTEPLEKVGPRTWRWKGNDPPPLPGNPALARHAPA